VLNLLAPLFDCA